MRNRVNWRALLHRSWLSLLAVWWSHTAQAQTLRIGVQAETLSMDPHFSLIPPSMTVSRHVFDTLAHPDERQKLQPGLALSWSAIEPTEWEFRLRPDVRFHDGTPFTAADVAFTMIRAPDVPNASGGFRVLMKHIIAIQVVDPLTIRFRTETPFPLMAEHLGSVPIISRSAAEGMTSADFNSGKATVGTGPFRFVSWTKGDQVRLIRNDTSWANPAPWAEVAIRPISDDGARIAALLSGSVDAIDRVPISSVSTLRDRPEFVLAQTVSNRVIFIAVNVDPTANSYVLDASGAPLARNPFADQRVRLAISKAIDRGLLTSRIMEGLAVPAAQLLPDGYPGTSANLKPEPYDQAGARALLVEAGYKDGFALTLLVPRDSNANDVKLTEAVAQMLTRIGLRVSVETIPFSVFQPRYRRGDFALAVRGWSTETGEVSMALRSLLATSDMARGWGPINGGRYSNPAMDALLERALSTLDSTNREALVAQATEMAVRDVAIVPLHYQVAVWGFRRGLTYKARSDSYTFAFDIQQEGRR